MLMAIKIMFHMDIGGIVMGGGRIGRLITRNLRKNVCMLTRSASCLFVILIKRKETLFSVLLSFSVWMCRALRKLILFMRLIVINRLTNLSFIQY